MVDDSIVRGNTQRAQVRLLREAGALEVHVRISSPPVKWPCFYGIDFATRAELIANGLDGDEIAASVGADSLGYISLDGMIEATGQPSDNLCKACFTGEYPVALPDESLLGKHLLETSLEGAELRQGVARAQQPVRTPVTEPNAYAEAGVNIEAADTAVELMKSWVDKARRPEVIGGLGGFAGLFDASALTQYTRPLLATSTDGVGTKVAIAQAMDIHDTIGFDLVGMVVDDLVVCGAEPLFMTDYIATGRVVPERIAAIVKGIAEACLEAGCALIGGETAEHPGLLGPDEYDVAGATTGVVEADRLLGPGRVRPGDAVIAMEASGLHSNGYSLVRHVLLGAVDSGGAGWGLDRDVPELGRPLGEELLEPTRIYAKACLALADQTEVHAMAHVTGGGLAANLARVMPAELRATVERATWNPQPIFDLVRRVGGVSQPDLESTLNCGVGMVALCPPDSVVAALHLLEGLGVRSWVAGQVDVDPDAAGTVRLIGQHPDW